ncbi:MAG: dTMP kinase, partial [Burkholderiales bacterium]|nr:dTMP kinase [Burkholderiales bacterium]
AAAARRAAARAPDRFERQDEAFFERVRAAYARRADDQPQRFVRIDSAPERAAVQVAVLAAVEARAWW